jgi:hypothetical protein
MITKPLTDLLRGKKPEFVWGPSQQKAFDHVKDLLLGGIHLAAPDFALPFHLASDASEDGKGAVLYQLPDVPLDQQTEYSARTHSPDQMAVIMFLSKAWSETERNRPPFYLEADALLWSTKKSLFYALLSPFPLYTCSDHQPLNWMTKSEKGPVSKFLIEELSELETVHSYIPGRLNAIPDAASRYPLLGPKRISPRGLSHSLDELLSRLPSKFKSASPIHVSAGSNSADVRKTVQSWTSTNDPVLQHAPPRAGSPLEAALAIMIPRPEIAPVSLALYLLSNVPFAILIPVDLLTQVHEPKLYLDSPHEKLKQLFDRAGKITLLAPQMTWVLGNMGDFAPIEMFNQEPCTPFPSPGTADVEDEFADPTPQTIENWIEAQRNDPDFPALISKIEHAAARGGLHITAAPDSTPKLIVPASTFENLVRFTHKKMFHLGAAKVFAEPKKIYFWPTMKSDVTKTLKDCPDCELEKARQQTAHGLFSARPHDAPRSRWAMDFQGQGTAITGETQALGLIDTTARHAIVIPLVDREASTFIQPFLDQLVFVHGPPHVLHSDAAAEFMSEALKLLAEATDAHTTTTMGHNANANGTIEVFWRYWNRCMRLLNDDHYKRWPLFASRICYAYNSAIHDSLGGVSPYEMFFGVPARNPFEIELQTRAIEAELPDADLENPAEFAAAIKVSVTAFTRLARNHTDYVRATSADRLNRMGHPKTYAIGDRVKIRVPPSHQQMLATGRRSSHLAAWRGPCSITARLSTTSYSMTEISTGRSFERVISNILPCRAVSIRSNTTFDPTHSDPFAPGEFVAVRDAPSTPFYIAKATSINATGISAHYHGCTHRNIARAVFKPCWHAPNSNAISLALLAPANEIPCTGELQFDSLRNLLVARNLEFTNARKLRKKSERQIAPLHDELFIFDP